MNDSVKKAAVEKLIEIKGKKFLDKHKDDFAISYLDVYSEYVITFILSKSTGNVNQNKLVNKETPIQNYMTVSVNKKTNECVVLEDKFLDV